MTTGTQQTNASQNTQNQGQVNPWAPAVPALTSLLGQTAGLPGTPTFEQNQSAGMAQQAAYNNLGNNFGQPVAKQAGAFLGGDPFGLLAPGLAQYNKTLAPLTDWGNVDPSKNPATASLIQSILQPIQDSINGQFAGAGRDLSGMNTKALGLGETAGLAPTLFGQYNQNIQNLMNAGSQLFGANYNTSGAMGGNVNQGLGLAAAQPGIATAPANALLQADTNAAMLPYQMNAAKASLLLPMAGAGSSQFNTGSSNTNATTQITPSLMSSILEGLKALPALSSLASGASNVASGAKTLF